MSSNLRESSEEAPSMFNAEQITKSVFGSKKLNWSGRSISGGANKINKWFTSRFEGFKHVASLYLDIEVIFMQTHIAIAG